jgi:chromosome partitioning protein
MAVLEKRTLLVDADPQANSTSGLGLNPKDVTQGIYECMVDGVEPKDATVKNELKFLDILPSHIDLVGAEVEMVNIERREEKMREALGKVRDEYDYIIIDCSPSLGLITINALTAADSIIIPVQCEYFALEGLGKLLNTIKIIQTRLNPKLEIEGILLTLYDARTSLGNQVVEEVRTHFQKMTFNTIIPRNVKLSESPSFGLPAIVHDAESKGAISYLTLAHEILDKNGLSK